MTDPGQAWIAAMREDRFADAWTISDGVLRARDPATRDDPTKPFHLRWVWDGRPFDDRHVLVRCYHGLGDTIQFARYLPPLARRAASVTVEVQPTLLPLLSRMDVLRWMPFDPAHPLPRSECDIEIMELAFAMRLPPSEVPPPYLYPLEPASPGKLVGLCHIAGGWEKGRCVPSELFASICHGNDCLSLMPDACALPVLNPRGCSPEIMETAMLIASTRLVITVDTMVAHLAGALGHPTWVLLKADPDWRWSLGRSSSWYPTMRLYRQPRPGDWASVIADVERDLAAWREVGSTAPDRDPFIERDEARN
ncbi:MAG: hypothetical protein JF628_15295 [Sphingomonas sp.]|nr:hypothetical protein [Sphingomonas sp.]